MQRCDYSGGLCMERGWELHGLHVPVITEPYVVAELAWTCASGALEAAKARQHAVRPIRQITLQEAQRYVAYFDELMAQGDPRTRQRFLASVIQRVVVFDDEGVIELDPRSAVNAIESVAGQLPKQAHDILLDGTPNGIRTRVATLKGWCPGPLDDGGAGDGGHARALAATQQCTRPATALSSAPQGRRMTRPVHRRATGNRQNGCPPGAPTLAR
jgi:hypothetical protein